jgi:predicted dehydrogenase
MTKKLRVGIIGAGLIGNKRAKIIKDLNEEELVMVVDIDKEKAKSMAENYNCEFADNWQELVKRPDIDIVIVSTTNNFLAPISIAALKNKKHVLCEKPFGRNVKESKAVLKVAQNSHRLIKVGFNHRFHQAISQAKKIFDEGKIGKILFIRSRYGHGGRLGMEKEWRLNKKISGGGVIVDQGVHIIDLCRYFVGDFNKVYGIAKSKFWKTKLDDNTFVLMENKNVTASFHVSTTNWKNIFSFEIFGDKGFLNIEGKGGSFGEETLTFGKRKPEFGVPEIEIFKFSGDTSWQEEWKNFISAVKFGKKIIGDGRDGFEANRIIEAIYRSSKSGRAVKL